MEIWYKGTMLCVTRATLTVPEFTYFFFFIFFLVLITCVVIKKQNRKNKQRLVLMLLEWNVDPVFT